MASPQWSADLGTWTTNGVMVSSADQRDGTVIEVWRAPASIAAGVQFVRLRVTRP